MNTLLALLCLAVPPETPWYEVDRDALLRAAELLELIDPRAREYALTCPADIDAVREIVWQGLPVLHDGSWLPSPEVCRQKCEINRAWARVIAQHVSWDYLPDGEFWRVCEKENNWLYTFWSNAATAQEPACYVPSRRRALDECRRAFPTCWRLRECPVCFPEWRLHDGR